MGDLFADIFSSISHNKTRVALTGFSIAWGIFLLIVLLGVGDGILNGITNAWVDDQNNIMTIEPSSTMLPYNGMPAGRSITLSESDASEIQEHFEGTITTTVVELDRMVTTSYQTRYSQTDLAGFYPGYNVLKNNILVAGRDINQMDIEQQRKVCVISTNLCKRLMPDLDPEEIVGEIINIHDVAFSVVGVYRPSKSYNVSRTVIAPFSTVKNLFFRKDEISRISMIAEGLSTSAANNAFIERLREHIAYEKRFSPEDRKAVTITNDYEMALFINELYSSINLFLWIVGLSTLIAGIVGVSNIMLISVRERTRELGVRKAMGASRGSILRLVLLESVMVTVIFGYLGMILGLGVIELADFIVSSTVDTAATGLGSSIFMNPHVDAGIVLGSTLIMIVSGLIAGYVPAKNAVSIKLVEALAAKD